MKKDDVSMIQTWYHPPNNQYILVILHKPNKGRLITLQQMQIHRRPLGNTTKLPMPVPPHLPKQGRTTSLSLT